MLATRRRATKRPMISVKLQRLRVLPCSFGTLHARAVAAARTSGGKTLGSARSGQICQALGFHPAASPGAHDPITTPDIAGNLLIAPCRMLVRNQNYPSTH